ncbi:MAG: prenyltransferase [Actinomycetota bacterium]|nr:prenyltransferase [Actinomycetota bacterium]
MSRLVPPDAPSAAAGRRVLDAAAVAATADSIEQAQRPSGMIPWFEGGHADPWNHVEAAMALASAGRFAAAERAYEWLAATQLESGAWHAYSHFDGTVEDARLDTNVSAYVATGMWHHVLATGSTEVLEQMWPVVERAVGFVLEWQREGGELLWSIDPDGTPGQYALLTGSSSAYFSLRCAVACAEALGLERPDWELAIGRLRHAIAYRPDSFEPKRRYAMDWYYPVLSGALEPRRGSERIDDRWGELVMEGSGVRCVADRPWVTVAETAECAMALLSLGRKDEAEQLLCWTQQQRREDGSYTTGLVYPQGVTFPAGECSTYSAAAMLLAVDCLNRTSAASGLFFGESLPFGLDLDLDSQALEEPA